MSINKIQINNKTQNYFSNNNYFNPKNSSYKFLSEGKNKLDKDNLKTLPNNNNYIENNYYKKNSFSSRDIQKNNNGINLIVKSPRNTNLFNKIKKLLSDFQKENAEKNHLYNYKKGNKKSKNKNKSNSSSNKIQKLSSLLAPHKKVYYSIPKIKNQMQLNHYLINDFKEVDSEQAYVTRSLKYQKMKEDFDELIYINQIKEAEKNGVTENDYEKNENNIFGFYDDNDNDNNNEDIKKNDFQINNKNNDNNNLINAKNRDRKKKNSIFNNNIYDMSLRRLYTENTILNKKNDINKENNINNINNINNNNNLKVFEKINSSNIPNNPSFTSRTKISENDNSLLENNDINKLNKSVGIRFLMDKRAKTNLLTMNNNNNLNNINENQININNNNNNTQKKEELKQTKKKKARKESLTIDKYSVSNKIYRNQRIEYSKYKKKQQKMRSSNFSKQIALLFKEKERYGINDNINETKGHPKLDHKKLLYQMQLRDIFTNSFNTMRLLDEGDEDLDLDNLNKIKQYIKDYENEMTRVLKNNNNFNIIKKNFNSRTLGKFHSSRGIYM